MITGTEHLRDKNGLPAFAAANGWRYDATADPPALGESLWEQVSLGTVRDRISAGDWEVGTITGGSRTARSVEQRGRITITREVSVSTPVNSIRIGYMAMTLPRRMPHFLLDAIGNDRRGFSSLLRRPQGDQQLPLEGDFNSHFRLYVPAGYEQDALYLFTPDLMALLIDETGDLDVEIRDDRLIVYSPGGFDLAEPRTWERLAAIRAVLGAKVASRSAPYADERAAASALQFEVAAPGQRLRNRMPRVAWIGIGAAIFGLVVAGVAAVAALSLA